MSKAEHVVFVGKTKNHLLVMYAMRGDFALVRRTTQTIITTIEKSDICDLADALNRAAKLVKEDNKQ